VSRGRSANPLVVKALAIATRPRTPGRSGSPDAPSVFHNRGRGNNTAAESDPHRNLLLAVPTQDFHTPSVPIRHGVLGALRKSSEAALKKATFRVPRESRSA